MDNSAESIKRELHFGSNNKLKNAFQKLLDMGYSVNDACAILADYREQAADEAEYMDEVDEYFNCHLKNIASGRYDQEDIDSHLYYLPGNHDETDGFNDFLSHLEDPYDELGTKEEAELYLQYMDGIYSALNKLVEQHVTQISKANLNGHHLIDVIVYSADALSTQYESKEYQEEAARLSGFVLKYFEFDPEDEEEGRYLDDLFDIQVQSLNDLGRYQEADAVLDEMEKYLPRGEVLQTRIYLMDDRNQEEVQRAADLVVKVLNDHDFIENDESSILFLRAADYLFNKIDDEEHLQQVEDLMEQKGYMGSDEDDPFMQNVYRMPFSALLGTVDTILEENPPEIAEIRDRLKKIGFHDDEIRMALAGALFREMKSDKYDDEEECDEEAWNLLNHADAEQINDDICDADLDELEDLIHYDDLDYSDLQDEQKKLADIIIQQKDTFKNTVLDYIKRAGTNSFSEICNLMTEDGVWLDEFLQDCCDALNDTGHYQECLDFTQFILNTFDFKDDDSSMEPILKELAVESLDGLEKHKEADQYIDEWMRKEPGSTRPIWAKMISLKGRNENEKALKLADQVMKMDLDDSDDTEVLLVQVQDIYEESGDASRIKKIHNRLDEYYRY